MDKLQIIKIIKQLAENSSVVEYDKIPEIDLYMDQLTTFTEDKLKSYKRKEDDKILTKTMINNYSKEKLLPPSAKKKYSKTHIALMLMIYHMKNNLALNDIAALTSYISNKAETDETSHEDIYKMFTGIQQQVTEQQEQYFANIAELNNSNDITLSAILHLILDANFKKRAAEKLIDTLLETKTKNDK